MKNSVRNYIAATDMPPYRIAKFGTTDDNVSVADDSDDALAGVTLEIDVKANGRVDIAEDGAHSVQLGGSVTRGDFLTSGPLGQAVKCTTGNFIAQAKQSGVAGDIIYIHICRGVI